MLVNAVAPWEGALVWVGTPNGGFSQSGQEWKSVDFTLKYQDHQMQERFITFSVFGLDKVNKLLSTPIGTVIRVTWVPETREARQQDGSVKWWPKLSALNIATPQAQPVQQPQQGYGQPAYPQYPQQGTAIPPQAPAYQQPQQPLFQQPAPAPSVSTGPIGIGADDDCPF